MPTTRTPIARLSTAQITPRAVKLFERLQACSTYQEQTELEFALHRELRLRLWEEAVEHPDARGPPPPASFPHKLHVAAQARWRALEAAAREQAKAVTEAEAPDPADRQQAAR